MTQKEKIVSLKDTIQFLYEKEGRPKAYIARLLMVDRSALSKQINAWGLVKANAYRMTPSNQKFANRHRQLIKSRFDHDVSESEIARELGVTRDYLRYIVSRTPELKEAKERYVERLHNNANTRRADLAAASKLDYDFEPIAGEKWRSILGHPEFEVSDFGRVRRYGKSYQRYYLRKPYTNPITGRLYISIEGKSFMLARLVAYAFVDGNSAESNTVDHIDGDIKNNRAKNLRWVSQGENNKHAYELGRVKNRAYQTNGKFKKIILDDKYEFKTIEALSRFLGVSPTQTQRYIKGETKFNRKIQFVY